MFRALHRIHFVFRLNNLLVSAEHINLIIKSNNIQRLVLVTVNLFFIQDWQNYYTFVRQVQKDYFCFTAV